MDGFPETPRSGTRPGPLSGVVWAYRFRDGEAAEVVHERDVGDALEVEEGWLWLHLNLADARARSWIATTDILPAAAKAVFSQGEERLGLDVEDDAVFGVIADFERGLEPASEDVGRLRFALTERIVISARRHALRSVEETRQALEAGRSFAHAGQLMDAIVDRFCDAVAGLVAEMTDDLDSIEDRVVSDVIENQRLRLVPIRRTAVRLHRQLSSLAAVMRDFDKRANAAGRPGRLSPVRLAGRLEALDGDLAIIQERAKLLQDEVSAKLAEETNRTLGAISTMTAFLLPGSLIAGLFGMNVGGLPLLHSDAGFWIVALLCCLATFIFYMLIRRTGSTGDR